MKCIKRCYKCYRDYREYDDEINLNQLKKLKVKIPSLIILDVRSPQEYEEGHMLGSICIPNYDIKHMVEKIIPDKTTTIVVYCTYGGRSRKTVNLMKDMGYINVYNLKTN